MLPIFFNHFPRTLSTPPITSQTRGMIPVAKCLLSRPSLNSRMGSLTLERPVRFYSTSGKVDEGLNTKEKTYIGMLIGVYTLIVAAHVWQIYMAREKFICTLDEKGDEALCGLYKVQERIDQIKKQD